MPLHHKVFVQKGSFDKRCFNRINFENLHFFQLSCDHQARQKHLKTSQNTTLDLKPTMEEVCLTLFLTNYRVAIYILSSKRPNIA